MDEQADRLEHTMSLGDVEVQLVLSGEVIHYKLKNKNKEKQEENEFIEV